MLFVAVIAFLVVMVLALARAFSSPVLFDRILAVNMFGTKTVLLVSTMSVVANDSSFLDIAIVYALINFIGILAVLRFFEYNEAQGGA